MKLNIIVTQYLKMSGYRGNFSDKNFLVCLLKGTCSRKTQPKNQKLPLCNSLNPSLIFTYKRTRLTSLHYYSLYTYLYLLPLFKIAHHETNTSTVSQFYSKTFIFLLRNSPAMVATVTISEREGLAREKTTAGREFEVDSEI